MSTLQIPDSMRYGDTSKDVAGELNYFDYQPVAGSEWRAGDSFRIEIKSKTSFLIPSKCYLQYTLTNLGTGSNALTNLGGVACLKRCVSTVGGTIIEDVDNYNHYLSLMYKRMPSEYQNLLKTLEHGDITTTNPTTGSISASASVVVNHAVRCGLLEGHDRLIPLPFIGGGVSLEFTLAPDAVVISAATYKISNVRFVAGMVTPSGAYLSNFADTLRRDNRIAKIPLQLVKNVNFVPQASATQEFGFNIGYLKSLRSMTGAFRTNANAGSSSAWINDTSNKLIEYYFQSGTQRYPFNRTIKHSSTNGENLMQLLCSVDNTFVHLNPGASSTAASIIHYNWCVNPGFGNGLAVEDAIVRFSQTYSDDSPSTAGTFNAFWVYDGVLQISASSCWLDVKNLS